MGQRCMGGGLRNHMLVNMSIAGHACMLKLLLAFIFCKNRISETEMTEIYGELSSLN